MKITRFEIEGLMLFEPPIYGDERGFFTERWKKGPFHEAGVKVEFVQDNFSRSEQGVLRGLHAQYKHEQSKLVTCVNGEILDVAVDIRKDSPTFGKHIAIKLSGSKPQWFWIPAGFAHGFVVLSPEGADLWYKVDALYNKDGEVGISWDDPDLNINWHIHNPKLSEKDKSLTISFQEYSQNPRF